MTKKPKYTLSIKPNTGLTQCTMSYRNLGKTLGKCLGVSLMLSVVLFACASTPPSTTLPQSKVAVSSVDHTNYRKYMGSDIDAVKAKLKQAESLAAEKQHVRAEQLAQQILVDVELIQIKTQRMNVDQEVAQIEDSIANVNQELKWREPVQISPLKP